MRIAILWHFHQPIYRKPGSYEFVLPWVNFHLKNYHQMARIVEESGIPGTFNLVPCLIEQIRDYSEGRAVDATQSALEKPPAELTEADLVRLRPFAPGENDPLRIQSAALPSFLSPVEPIPEYRDALLETQSRVLHGLLPTLRRLWLDGAVELTATPYYHPLTPLICDLEAARGHSLPVEAFRYPEDARRHLDMSVSCFEGVFGRRPAGLWPSEGGISPAVTRAAAEAGFPFALTDENVLWKSLGVPPRPALLQTPYRSEGLPVFFRDRELSDLIGFEYWRWKPEEAADDLLRRIRERRTNDPDEGLVLALDGENPWAGYRENGVPFLRALFDRLARADGIQPSFFQDLLTERRSPLPDLDLVPGTWLGNFSKWIGDPAKNEGWNILSRARRLCGPIEEILIAEGSDWFWWFGEGHPEFDALFLAYIREAYRKCGLPFPEERGTTEDAR